MRLKSLRRSMALVDLPPVLRPERVVVLQIAEVAHKVSQRSVGPCRGESRPDHTEVPDTRDQGAQPHRMQTIWQAALRLNDRVENCWIGDLLGVISLFGLLIIGTIMVGVLQ